jgi:ABC-type nitrate/sulfonate/bicarbonate transport system permease component
VLRRSTLTYGLRLAVLAAALGLWQGLSAAGVIRADEFPSMSQTATALWDLITQSVLWSAVGETLEGWALGLVIGVAAALLLGTLIGMNGFAYRSVIGVIEFFKAIPVIAILPIGLVLWGATLTMKFALVAFAVFWPLVIQVCYGVRSLDPVARDTTTVLQVRGPRKFFTVTLPSAAPFIATGLRVAVAVALIVDIIAELIGGGSGVGERILVAENAGPSQYPQMYAYIVVAGVLGILLAGAFTVAERYVLHWHESQRAAKAESQNRRYSERRQLTVVVQLSAKESAPRIPWSLRVPPSRTRCDARLAVRGPVRGVVVLVGRVEVAVLPTAVADPQDGVGPVGHRTRPRTAHHVPGAPARRVRDRRPRRHRGRRAAVFAAAPARRHFAVPVLPLRAACPGARPGRDDAVRHRLHDEGGAHRVRRRLADAA